MNWILVSNRNGRMAVIPGVQGELENLVLKMARVTPGVQGELIIRIVC